MKEAKHIVDTTLRDGEQSPGIALNAEDKVKVARMLDEIGVYEIEAGTPCIGRTEEESICRIMEIRPKAKVSVWSRMNVEDVKKSLRCRPDIIHIGTPVSYIQIYSKLRKNKVWVQKNVLDCVEAAMKLGAGVTVGLEDASRADIGFIISLISELRREGVETIRIADTVGVLTPGRTEEIVRTIKNHSDIKIELHIHNDLGMAVANSIVGAKAGAEYIDCTLFGIGERTGNCNFYDLIAASEGIFRFPMRKKDVEKIEKEAYTMLKGAL